ncbi:hypothetical protein GGH94_000615 [Coemansia aciculifera]|uniref:Uncharacterized protein n=1 Tax=Coemansia aciculifera TaxID=417176 RepID=A0A9W8IU51_9FUNG|nr:hypothetical protein GGH94_000615 [Coemansia aciculifera]
MAFSCARLCTFLRSDSSPESSAGVREYISPDNDSDDEENCDYVCTASATSDSSDDEDSSEDSEWGGELVGETAALVGEIFSGGTQPSGSNGALASAVAFIAHSVYGPGSAMTRAMYARHMAQSEQIPRMLLLSRTETESLAALIRSKRPAAEPVSEDGVFCVVFCVVCWESPRCVMLHPCRCLCLYNECRSALALRNFAHCSCCRRSAVGYSRVYAV